jgi:hypothetical protein
MEKHPAHDRPSGGAAPRRATRPFRALLSWAAICAAALFPAQCERTADVPRTDTPVAVCFAPGTPSSYVEDVTSRLGTGPRFRFFAPGRWTVTATDGLVGERGTPITLTWAVVPDGTPIEPSSFGGSGSSDLRKALNGIYGSQSAWLPLFEKMFENWSAVSGVRYVRETEDDGATLGTASGVRGVRADVRIGGRAIDGDYGILAYNGYPNDGDMVLDSADAWFRSTSFQSRALRNVAAHEHGHGLGLDHVCPSRGNKLMEPSISLSFDGPQHDDILGAQRLYGDSLEPNGSLATATDLGAVGATRVTIEGVSIDGTNDTDLYAFTAAEGANADVVLQPAGREYDHAAPNDSGGCGPASNRTDSRKRADLRLALLRADGSTLAATDATGLGEDESLLDVPLDRGAAQYFVRVRCGDPGDVQLYRLEVRAVQRGEKPSAAPDAAATWEVLPVATDVLANDAGVADEPLRLRVTARPANGRAILFGRRVVYVPRRGFTGEDRYTYEVSDVHRQASTADVTVSVAPGVRAGSARNDTDGDGYPDEFEVWRGTAPDDAGSRPGEDISAGAAPPALTKVLLRVRSHRTAADEIRVRGRVALSEDFTPDGATVLLSVAGVPVEFTLDRRGGSVSPAAALRLRRLKPRAGGSPGEWSFDVVLRDGSFAASWADEGLTTERRQRSEPRAATLFLLVAGRTFAATAPLAWSATPGRTGTARLVR